MKRLAAVAVLLLVPCASYAFDTKRHAPRVGVVRMTDELTHAHAYVADSVVKYLCSELQERGIDAFDTERTYGEIAGGEGEDADYYVEIAGARAESGSHGGIGIGRYDIGVSVDVVVSRVAGEVRGSRLFAVVAMPFVQRSQYKTLTRSAARDAAMVVVSAIQPQ